MSTILQRTFGYLSIYLSASIDIVSALEMVSKRMKHKRLKHLFIKIQGDIKEGKSIKDAFAILKQKRLLDSVAWAIFVSAERGGNTKDAFYAISKNLEHQSKNKMSLIGALAYPIGMFLASCCMTIFLVTVAFPKITPLFKSLNAPMPTATLYILYVSKFISDWGLYVACIVCASSVVFLYVYRTYEPFRYTVETYLLRVPILSNIFLYREYASIASSLEILLKNNTTISESLYITKDICSFLPFKKQLEHIHGSIQVGRKVSNSFESESFFKTEWVDFISVGEMTGQLDDSFRDIANLYQERYKESVQLLVRLSEPIALFCTAIVVLIIALSVITPMYSIIQQVQR